MKVLWIVNLPLPELAASLGRKTGTSGTWLIDLSKGLSEYEDVELAIACIDGGEFIDKTIGKIRYFCIPGNGKTMLFYHKNIINYWDIIEERFNPDIIHFHGTEYTHGISYLRKYKDKKKVLTIQGITGKTSENHWGGLPLRKLMRYRTLKEYLHLNGMIERKILAKRNVKYEKEYIRNIFYATGRTDWDKFYMQSLNPDLEYFRCNYNLREEFYKADKWEIEKCKRRYVYASTSAQVPLKGGHMVLQAANIVRRKFPDVKFVFLAGKVNNGMLVPQNGYQKYIFDTIKKLGIEDNVEFVGPQNTGGVIDIMLSSNIVLVPSAMENASATLREAMHLGVPSIAAFRGGMPALIEDGKNGFLYDYNEYEYLAGRIIDIFSNDELAKNFSLSAIKSAEVWHDREKNVAEMKAVYDKIMEIDKC